MYTKQYTSQLREEFWTIFGQYMAPVPNTDGEKINWVNYKTGSRFVQFKMEAGSTGATVAIEIFHPEMAARDLYFQHLLSQKKMFENIMGDDWIWHSHHYSPAGKTVALITKKISTPDLFNKATWPEIVGFFKKSIIAFDSFWQMAKYSFDAL